MINGNAVRDSIYEPHLIIPMAGAGSRFSDEGFELPKPIIEIEGKPFFYWAVRSIEKFVDLEDITFVILQEHMAYFHLDDHIRKYFPEARIVVVPTVTAGPVLTCLEGLRDISDDAPVIFNDCDHMFGCRQLYGFLNEGIWDMDGALLTFPSGAPNFSYVKYNDGGEIIGTVEKQVVSNHAICGAYVFRSAGIFRSISEDYLKECPYKECYLSGMYNVMCEKKMRVVSFTADFHVEFGTPKEYKKAIGSVYFRELV